MTNIRFAVVSLLLLGSSMAMSISQADEGSSEQAKSSIKREDNRGLKIGIIGGGPAGLFAARHLAKSGYNHVTVLEAGPAPADLLHSISYGGKTHDFTTRYIPSVHPNGPGTMPLLQAMIDEYQQGTHPVNTGIDYVNMVQGYPILLSGPHIFADYFAPGGAGPNALVGEIIWGYELLKTLHNIGELSACRALLQVAPGVTFAQWAAAVNKPAFTRMAAYTNDLFLSGPSNNQDVCKFLNVRSHFMVGDMVGLLKSFGLTDQTTLPISAELRSLLGPTVDPRRKSFNNGYKAFFQALVNHEQFEFVPNAKVTGVASQGSNMAVTTASGASYSFDRIIVATRPADALKFLPANHPATALYAQTYSHPVHVFGSKTSGTCPVFSSNKFTAVMYPAAILLGSPNMPPTVVGINKEYPDIDLTITAAYADIGDSLATGETKAKGNMMMLGLTPSDTVFSRQFDYPVFINQAALTNDWFGQMDNVQGVNGFYFLGEALSGYGVPAILEHTTTTMEEHFDLASMQLW